MTSGRPTENALPRRTLAQAARSGASGALHVDGSPGGTLFLAHGSVTYAESPAAPGVGELLTASGRLSRNTWRACFDAGRDEYRVGHVLVEQGHLTAGELELCVLGATYDAAFFVLQPRPAPVRFVAGERHWLGTLTQVDVTALDRETTRRHRLPDEITPESAVDGAPVTPVTRPPVDRVVLMALQWELLMHADGRRTPADLARLLGRAGYATLLELRRLAAAGLLLVPRSVAVGPAASLDANRSGGAGAKRPVAGSDRPVAEPDRPVAKLDRPAAQPDRPVAGPGHPDAEPNGSPRLPRRRPGAALPDDRPHVEPDPVRSGPDHQVLGRIHGALKGLR